MIILYFKILIENEIQISTLYYFLHEIYEFWVNKNFSTILEVPFSRGVFAFGASDSRLAGMEPHRVLSHRRGELCHSAKASGVN